MSISTLSKLTREEVRQNPVKTYDGAARLLPLHSRYVLTTRTERDLFVTNLIETHALARRYGSTWALRDCTLSLPAGVRAGLVGPNGAGKTTFLHLIMGLLEPSEGSIQVLGFSPYRQPQELLPLVGFLAQDRPLYRSFSVQDLLTFACKLNPRWDEGLARRRLQLLGIPLNRPAGRLSGGQQAQVALALALAKHPRLLVLDEPVASLDPLARFAFQQDLLETAAQDGLTLLLSSHLIADLERVCDYIIIIAASRVQFAGSTEQLLQTHKRLTVPSEALETLGTRYTVLHVRPAGQMHTVLVHTNGLFEDPWTTQSVSLEEVILAYLAQAAPSQSPLLSQSGKEMFS